MFFVYAHLNIKLLSYETLGISFTVLVVIPRKTGRWQTKGGNEVQSGRSHIFWA